MTKGSEIRALVGRNSHEEETFGLFLSASGTASPFGSESYLEDKRCDLQMHRWAPVRSRIPRGTNKRKINTRETPMKKLLLLSLVAIGLALVPAKQADAQVSVGVGGVGVGFGYPAYRYSYYGYPGYYGYYPYSYYGGYPYYRTYYYSGRPYYYSGHRVYRHHKHHHHD